MSRKVVPAPVFIPWNPNTSNEKLHGSVYDPPGPADVSPPSPSSPPSRAPAQPWPGGKR